MGNTFYLDCEFDGHGGPLLSLALVGDSGDIHIRTEVSATNSWVQDNVVTVMDSHRLNAFTDVTCPDENYVGGVIRDFLKDCEHPVIIADSPVDIWRFCKVLSTDETGNWCSTDYSRMTFRVENVDSYPTNLHGAVQHNAWWDAAALRYKIIMDSFDFANFDHDPELVSEVLQGDLNSLLCAFMWGENPQGHMHWQLRCWGDPLDVHDINFLKSLRR